MIGGCLATNSMGIDVIKRQSLRANTIGLKVVLPNGDVLDNMTTLRKDNTGYDLKQLFIGAEGTLGIITECAILCGPPKPEQKNLCFLTPKTFEDCIKITQLARTELGDIMNVCEFMDWESVSMSFEQFPQLKYPFQKPCKYHMMIEVESNILKPKEGEEGQKARDPGLERLFNFVGKISDDHLIDGMFP